MLSTGALPFVNSENFKVITWAGDGVDGREIEVGFQPDFVWFKARNQSYDHNASDSTRGTGKQVRPNRDIAEVSATDLIKSFTSTGFTVGTGGDANVSGNNYVAWCWKANGGTTSSNSDGSITSTVQANTDAGFSIVTYTGTGSNASVGHGLGKAPKWILVKMRSSAKNWVVYHAGNTNAPETEFLTLNSNVATEDYNMWQDTAPTSSVFTISTNDQPNTSGETYVAYCFADIDAFSKFGSYTGNGSDNGPIVETGFEPAFIMFKRTDSSDNWIILDNARSTTNLRANALFANLTQTELTSGNEVDFLSNGFQIKTDDNSMNNSSGTYIYMAFAADPDEEAPTLTSSFNIETYTGNGGNPRSLSGFGLSPSFLWIKKRNSADDNVLFDSVRGPQKELISNSTAAEATKSGDAIISFDTDGFTTGNNGAINANGDDYVSWAWEADDNEPTYNTNGSINSIVSANANAGFSIVKWTGTGSNGTVAHGLSSTPELIISKNLDTAATDGWPIFTTSIGNDHTMFLNTTAGKTSTGGTWGSTSPTSTVFTVQDNDSNNQSGNEIIAYCFHSVTGYQKIGSYTGDGQTNQTITTGFKPDFIVIKSTVGNANWRIYDTRRSIDEGFIRAHTNAAEHTDSDTPNLEIISTGFKITSGGVSNGINANGNLYFYWAIAKNVPSNTTLASSFNAAFYAGSGSARSISTFGFKPDLIWFKSLSNTTTHELHDSVRPQLGRIYSNADSAQSTTANGFVSIDSNGFSLDGAGSGGDVNTYRRSYIAWGWKAGNTWESNIDGTQPSIVNANTANGFSIVKWKTNGSSSQTVGHGLSSTPELVIYKRTDSSQDWYVETNAIDGSYDYGNLNSNAAFTTNEAGAWSTRATSTTITNFTSSDNFEYIAYCWHSVSGYSDIGVYTGNGSSTGPTITTGFKTDFVLIKRVEGAASWAMVDSLRGGGQELYANLTDGDNAYAAVKFLSNGFQIINTANGYNANGEKYLYMAFAKNATNNNTLANSFKAVTYTGNGSTQEITGIGFKPDLVWIKQRNDTNPHSFFDTTRGAGKMLVTSTDAVEINNPGDILGYFLDDGFQVNRNHGVHSAYDNSNHSGSTYVAWCWKAGNGWQSNTTGSISSLTNANTANGFSIIKYTGTGSNATVGHGLSSAPTLIIAKRLNSAQNWLVGASGIGFTKYLELNDTRAEDTASTVWNNTAPTSTVVNFGTSSLGNGSGDDYIMYCFHDVAGYSKFGTYTGNGSSSGPYVALGFEPDFVMLKRTDATSNWVIADKARGGSYNDSKKVIFANLSNAESESGDIGKSIEFNAVGHGSNPTGGFQLGNSDNPFNVSSGEYIYIAFKMN